jgi:Zn-dependent protease with chaperone function
MSIEEIRRRFSGRLVGKLQMRKWVCETVAILPEEMIEYITHSVWFLSSPEDAWAYTFRGNEVKGQHLVVLSDELFKQSPEDITYTIIHEIGHVMLGHKNSTGQMQTQTEIDIQEREADLFARKYLNT